MKKLFAMVAGLVLAMVAFQASAEGDKATSGWQDITFFNPVSKKIEPKRIYWERYDNLVFAAGAYRPEK